MYKEPNWTYISYYFYGLVNPQSFMFVNTVGQGFLEGSSGGTLSPYNQFPPDLDLNAELVLGQ